MLTARAAGGDPVLQGELALEAVAAAILVPLAIGAGAAFIAWDNLAGRRRLD